MMSLLPVNCELERLTAPKDEDEVWALGFAAAAGNDNEDEEEEEDAVAAGAICDDEVRFRLKIRSWFGNMFLDGKNVKLLINVSV